MKPIQHGTLAIADYRSHANAPVRRRAANPRSATRVAERRPDPAAAIGVSGPLRILSVSLAAVFLIVGLVGIVVPGLPATPFFLLTSYFLARSWPRMHGALLRSVVVGPVLRDWQRHRGVRPQVKVQALLFVVAGLALTTSFSGLSWPALAAVFPLAMIGLVVVYRLPTVTPAAIPDRDLAVYRECNDAKFHHC